MVGGGGVREEGGEDSAALSPSLPLPRHVRTWQDREGGLIASQIFWGCKTEIRSVLMELTSVFQLYDKCCLSSFRSSGSLRTLVGVKNFFMNDIHLASAVLRFKTEILVTILGCSTTLTP